MQAVDLFAYILQVHMDRNKQCLMSILRCCSHQTKKTEEVTTPTAESAMEVDESVAMPSHGQSVSGDLCRMIGSLMTELITPDVLYNNRFWPEEESIQMTVERYKLKAITVEVQYGFFDYRKTLFIYLFKKKLFKRHWKVLMMRTNVFFHYACFIFTFQRFTDLQKYG